MRLKREGGTHATPRIDVPYAEDVRVRQHLRLHARERLVCRGVGGPKLRGVAVGGRRVRASSAAGGARSAGLSALGAGAHARTASCTAP